MARPKRQHKDTRVKINLRFDEALAALTHVPQKDKIPFEPTSGHSRHEADPDAEGGQREADA
jgi:hypothetical protein